MLLNQSCISMYLLSGSTKTGKAANFLTHVGFSGRTTIDEDQYAKYE